MGANKRLTDWTVSLADPTGEQPMTWEQFQESRPKPKQHLLRNAALGAVMGVGAGATLAVLVTASPVLLVGGAVLGSLIGGLSDTQNIRSHDIESQYQHYLKEFSKAPQPAPAISMEHPVMGAQVEQLLARQQSLQLSGTRR